MYSGISLFSNIPLIFNIIITAIITASFCAVVYILSYILVVIMHPTIRHRVSRLIFSICPSSPFFFFADWEDCLCNFPSYLCMDSEDCQSSDSSSFSLSSFSIMIDYIALVNSTFLAILSSVFDSSVPAFFLASASVLPCIAW